MSDINETIYYKELQAGDAVHDGDQFRDVDGQWKPYIFKAHMGGKVAFGVTARRPIRATHQTTFEEVPGTRTLQQAVKQPQRERWAYEELQPGDLVQAGDQWQNSDGRWHALVLTPEASMNVGEGLRVRRPHNITMMLAAFASSAEVLANAQQAATQLQSERDEFQTALIESRLALKRKVAEVMDVCKERDDALTALKSAQRARDELQLQVDELRADRERLQGLIDNLLDEPTAKRVYKMLEDMLDQTEWVGQCLDSSTYEQMSCIQRTIANVAERVRNMVKEGASAND